MSDPTSPLSRSPARRRTALLRDQDSADEITPIVNHERGPARNYQTSLIGLAQDGHEAAEPVTSDETEQSEIDDAQQRPPQAPNRKVSKRPAEAEEHGDETWGWWKGMLDKYGAAELDNKGSVARDHLALGECRGVEVYFRDVKTLTWCFRAHFPRLASYLACFRVHRYSHHTALPPKHYTYGP